METLTATERDTTGRVRRGSTGPGPARVTAPEPDTEGSVEPMYNPLELTRDARRLSRSAPGRVLIVGARRDSRRLARFLSHGPWAGLTVVGFIDAGHPRYKGGLGRGRQLAVHPGSQPVPVLGSIDRLHEFVGRARATHVVVAVSGRPAKRLRPRIAQLNHADIAVHWVGDDPATLELTPPDPLTHPAGPWYDLAWPIPYGRLAKRAVDIAVAFIGLLLLAPLFAVVSLAILLSTGQPIFYFQERVGQGGRRFRIVKFRSMRTDAESQTGPIWATDHDTRCTRIGDWLRHTNIDELPQLFNVLRGEMSLVGPRPERPMFVEKFRQAVPDYDLRHTVPVGMTGWAQVHGWRGRTSLRKRVQYDLDYIQRWSFWLDFKILAMTVQHVAWGKISWGSARQPRPRVDAWPEAGR
jgi:exopolysaccharide biosynthesis polyprenyl glycosylphosphotransferase